MMFPINTKNHIEFGKCGKTTKVTNKEKNMNSSEAVRVDISETGMQMFLLWEVMVHGLLGYQVIIDMFVRHGVRLEEMEAKQI